MKICISFRKEEGRVYILDSLSRKTTSLRFGKLRLGRQFRAPERRFRPENEPPSLKLRRAMPAFALGSFRLRQDYAETSHRGKQVMEWADKYTKTWGVRYTFIFELQHIDFEKNSMINN